MQETVDVLNREQFIDMLYQLVNTMSDLKQGKIFSIDGTWGYGKTYVLEELERRLSPVVNEDTYDDTVIYGMGVKNLHGRYFFSWIPSCLSAEFHGIGAGES